MALVSDAAMVLFYDFAGDTSDHDDWHSHEHFHERLSVPGFLRATRWVAEDGGPRYMVTYEVSGLEVATSQGYLDRLNDPTPWTSEMMPRFRGMTRGFCRVAASAGFGLGRGAVALRFHPDPGAERQITDWLSGDILPGLAAHRGVVGAVLFQPAPPPPMTREQSLRGPDRPMPWLVVATGYDIAAVKTAASGMLRPEAVRAQGASDEIQTGFYTLDYTATAEEAARTAKPAVLDPATRKREGPRR